MYRQHAYFRVFILAVLVSIPVASMAVLPLIAGLGRQIVQNMLIDGVKGQLIGSLSGMGCRGAALTALVAPAGSNPLRNGAGGIGAGMMPPGLPGGGMPPMPGGVTPQRGMPGGPDMTVGSPRSMRAARGAAEIPTLPAGMDPSQMDMSQMMALVQGQIGSRMPGASQMSPEQMNQAMAAMSNMQSAMANPLSREETLSVFNELADLGVLTPTMQSEVRDCVTLASPAATQGLGQTGAIFKSMVLPQLRAARESMAALQPEQHEQMADEIVDALDKASPADRKAFLDGFGMGFFPGPVVDAVRSKLH
jgi:hypothetical protein